MKRIDRETVQKILDTADIVEVVSDFVSLKRRGSNYMGLCPFHNERTPSFAVSKTKGICKCFSCGKGGSPVNFIMEHEQMSFNEALRYLAKKYNIEIVEQEMTEKEREEESERESMMAVNEFALHHFKDNLINTQEGQDIGLSYLRERGISDAMINRFQLGYSLEQKDALYRAATAQGYNEKFLVSTGLCGKSDNDRFYDKYKGRVIFPIFGISGKAIAFGGRTLSQRKDIAKYVNSPESIVYHKSNVLYGLYQAKQAIVKQDRCILVEGYLDVISMYQSGIENVVASSGTSLTEGQIRLIHRFTENVLVIYDGDAAGIKASLRGIDMLLAEGLNIKVLLLPDGDDPDSFAHKHSSQELTEYIAQNETDFIRFKTSILLQGVENDPISRSKVINDIVRSISVIPNNITRSIYIKECSRMLDIDEKVLNLQVSKHVSERAEKESDRQQHAQASATIESIDEITTRKTNDSQQSQSDNSDYSNFLYKYETGVLRYALKYGTLDFCNVYDEDGNATPIKVIDYIAQELKNDDITFTNKFLKSTFDEALNIRQTSWAKDFSQYEIALKQQRKEKIAQGEEHIRKTAQDLNSISALEQALISRVDEEYANDVTQYNTLYIEKILTSSPDDNIRRIATDLVSERHVLSKVHTKYAKIETEQDRLTDLIPRSICEWKDAIIECKIKEIRRKIKEISASEQPDSNAIQELMSQNIELNNIKGELAKYLGERIIAPRK